MNLTIDQVAVGAVFFSPEDLGRVSALAAQGLATCENVQTVFGAGSGVEAARSALCDSLKILSEFGQNCAGQMYDLGAAAGVPSVCDGLRARCEPAMILLGGLGGSGASAAFDAAAKVVSEANFLQREGRLP